METNHIPDSLEECETEEEEEDFLNEQARRADLLQDMIKYGDE